MKKLYTATTVELEIIKSILESENIRCLIKDTFPQGMGLNPGTVWSSLWVVDNDQLVPAGEILKQILIERKLINSKTWTCKKCGAEVNPELNICWQCNHPQTP